MHSRPRTDGPGMLLFAGTSHGAYGPGGIPLAQPADPGLSWSTPAGGAIIRPSRQRYLGKWRNGRRARFRSVCPEGREGSTPSFPTRGAPLDRVGLRRFPGRSDRATAGLLWQTDLCRQSGQMIHRRADQACVAFGVRSHTGCRFFDSSTLWSLSRHAGGRTTSMSFGVSRMDAWA